MNNGIRTIVHIIYRLGIGGLENGLVNIINGLPRQACRHVIVCLAGYDSFSERLQRDDVEIVDLEKRPGKDPAYYLRLFRVLRQIRPDVVHTRNIAALDCQFVAALLRVPLRIHSEHGWDAGDPNGTRVSHRLLRRVSRLVVHRYMVVSRHMIEWLKNVIGVPDSEIWQIYNGIDCERFSPTQKSNDPEPTRLGIVTVGRLDPIKNQALLIEAYARMRGRLHGESVDTHLTLVGGGEMEDELRATVNKFDLGDAVSFSGAVSDVSEVLRANQLFVLPSLNEGVSNTVLEAMACGLPVIASNVGGNPEVVEDGRSGRLFESGESNVLSEMLLDYALDPDLRQEHGRQARQRAMQCFSMAAMLENYTRLYDLSQPAGNTEEV